MVSGRRPGGAPLVAAALGAAACVGACKPNLDDTVSVVTGPTVLAVQNEPPEVNPTASPPTPVTFTALYVTPKGEVSRVSIDWAFCDAREPLSELEPVNTECLETSGSWFVPLGTGSVVTGSVPTIACNQFGPDVPMVVAGQTPGRPVDPDATGGYYQPTRFIAPASPGNIIGIAETRIACGLAGATPDQVADFGAQYHYNVNPAVESLAIVTDGDAGLALAPVESGQTNPVGVGQHVTLQVTWPTCPLKDVCGDGVCGPDEAASTAAIAANIGSSCPAPTVTACPQDCQPPKGCQGAERYINYDLTTQCLVDARESMAVAWFATGGGFDNDRTGRTDTDTATTSDNGWQAPSQPGTVDLWVVLRDSRGGTGWMEYELKVQ